MISKLLLLFESSGRRSRCARTSTSGVCSHRGRAVVVMVVSLLSGSLVAFAGQARAGVQRPAVTLVSQSSYVSGTEGSLLQLSLQLSSAILESDRANSRLVLTAHRPITARADVRAAVEGDLPQIIDAVTFELRDLLETASQPATGRVDLLVRTEIGTRTPEALQMSATGTYPLTIDLEISGERITRLVSFVERLEPGTLAPSSATALGLALVGKVRSPISLGPDSRIGISPTTRRELLELTELFEARANLPLTIALQPELVDAFQLSDTEDQDLLIRFQRAAGFEAISTTYVDMDPTDVDRHGLSSIFTRQLRLGEATLSGLFPSLVTPRHSWMQSESLSSGGARILADLGFRTIVLSANAARESIDDDIDPRRLLELSFSDGGVIQGVTADGDLAAGFERGSFRPAGGEHLVALQLLAELNALRIEARSDGSADGRAEQTLILSTPTGDLPSARMTEAFVDVVSRDPRFTLIRLDDALDRMESVQEPDRVDLSDLSDREPAFPASASLGLVVAGLDSTIDAFASALPSDDERVRNWRRLTDVVSDNRMTAQERQSYVDSIRRGTEEIAAFVVPPASTTFTLGGRDSPIRFTIRNDGPTDLDVLVRLRSSKLRLPEGDKIVTLIAGASTAVEFAVNARSNGRFPVTLQMLTPRGDVVLGTPATLTARVNALAGLGQLVTGIALLFLLSWWANHLRQEYRRRQAETDSSAQRHPSADRPV